MLTTKLTLLQLSSLLSLLSTVSAHGYLRQIAIDGTFYRGNIPNQVTTFSSPIRAVDDIVPVKGAMNREVNCGINAHIASEVVAAKPGSEIAFDWAGGDNGKWPHNIGPMLTYLSTCGNTTCDKFDAINAQWFKIDQAGQKNESTWFQNDIMNGKTYSTHLPATLASGDYLIRHEIIALHVARTQGGAEFYPSCSQIRVSGNETGVPRETVSLPGAYSDTDPGILVPDVFNPGFNYTSLFPGPSIDPVLSSASACASDSTAQDAPSTAGLPDPSFTSAPSLKIKKVKMVNPINMTTTIGTNGNDSSSTMKSINMTITITSGVNCSMMANMTIVSGSIPSAIEMNIIAEYRPCTFSRIMRAPNMGGHHF